jgi:magnesium and cobalt transporter
MNNEDSESDSSKSIANGWRRRLGQSLVGPPRDRTELMEVLRQAQRNDLLDGDALWMMKGVLSVSEIHVRDIMVPRSQMVVVERDTEPGGILPTVIESGHSRFPVVGDSRDEVAGILLAKDLLRLALDENGEAGFDMRQVLRPAVFVPEAKRVNVLLKEFRASRNHMAVVVDEYGGVSGLVTIEDALEQIVGDIDDEYDVAEGAYIMRQDANRFLVRSLTPVPEFNRYFGAAFSDEEFDTIGGLVMHQFGHMPKRGETVIVDRFQFNVQRADSRRIHLLKMTVLPESESPRE